MFIYCTTKPHNIGDGNMATPIFDFSQIVNLLMQLMPLILVLAILPLIIRLFTGIFRE